MARMALWVWFLKSPYLLEIDAEILTDEMRC